MDKPRVDEIRGIPPAIAIEQANPTKSSRSTVGTMTEINDYLKLLWPRIAHAFCPHCEREIRPETAKSIADEVIRHFGRGGRHSEANGATQNGTTNGAAESSAATGLITFWVAVPPKP